VGSWAKAGLASSASTTAAFIIFMVEFFCWM
jgi:mevalonate kinase